MKTSIGYWFRLIVLSTVFSAVAAGQTVASNDTRTQFIREVYSSDSTALVKVYTGSDFNWNILAYVYSIQSGQTVLQDSVTLLSNPEPGLFISNDGRYLVVETSARPEYPTDSTYAVGIALQLYSVDEGLIACYNPYNLQYYEYGQYDVSDGGIDDWGRVIGIDEAKRTAVVEFHQQNRHGNPHRPVYGIDTLEIELATGKILWNELPQPPEVQAAPTVVWQHTLDYDSLWHVETQVMMPFQNDDFAIAEKVSNRYRYRQDIRVSQFDDKGERLRTYDMFGGGNYPWERCIPYRDGLAVFALNKAVNLQKQNSSNLLLRASTSAFDNILLLLDQYDNKEIIDLPREIKDLGGPKIYDSSEDAFLLSGFSCYQMDSCYIDLLLFDGLRSEILWNTRLGWITLPVRFEAAILADGTIAAVGHTSEIPVEVLPPETDARYTSVRTSAALPPSLYETNERRLLKLYILADTGKIVKSRIYWLQGWETMSEIIPVTDGFFVVGSTAPSTQEIRDRYGYESPWPRFQWDWEGENRDAFVLKFNMAGDTVWSHIFGGADADEAVHAVPDADGGLIVVGTTHSYGSGAGDALVYKLDADGHLVWSRVFGDDLQDSGERITRLANGELIVAYSAQDRVKSDRRLQIVKL